MTKKVSFFSQQPDPEGPTFGKVARPPDLQHLQDYMVGVLRAAIKDLLVAGNAGAVTTGFAATLSGNLGLSIAAGRVFDVNGYIYEAEAATALALQAASSTQPRIDLIYATLEIDAPALEEYVPFRRLPTDAERLAGTIFPNTPILVPTEFWTRAVVSVRTGTPAGVPVAPAVNAGEIALWRVHVAANQTVLGGGDLTDVRVPAQSLGAVASDLAELVDLFNAFVAGINATIDARIPAVGDPRYVNVGGDTMTGELKTPSGGLQVGEGTTNQIRTNANTGHVALRSAPDAEFALKLSGATLFDNYIRILANHAQVQFFDQLLASPAGRYYIVAGTVDDQDLFRLGRFFNAGLTTNQDILRLTGGFNVEIPFNLTVGGSFVAGSKAFLIDHPLDANNKNLRHAAIEAPRRDVCYRGRLMIPAGTTGVVDVDAASGMTAGTLAALADVANADIFIQNRTNGVSLPVTDNGDGTFDVFNGLEDDVIISWLYVAERIDPLVMALADSDEDGHLMVEENKPAADPDLLDPRVETVAAEEAAPDETYEEVVEALIGKVGYPMHARIVGAGAIPTREVTRQITDTAGNPYEPPPEP